MATYKEIKGTQIEVLASDPSNPVEGQVWYNSTSNVLKGQAATSAGSWATGGNVNTARSQAGVGGAGDKSSALLIGGAPSSGFTGATESYDGTSWTEVNDLNQARRGLAAARASNTSAIAAGGQTPPAPSNAVTALTEKWNGS